MNQWTIMININLNKIIFLILVTLSLSVSGQSVEVDTIIVKSHFDSNGKKFLVEMWNGNVRDSLLYVAEDKYHPISYLNFDTTNINWKGFLNEVKEKFNYNYNGVRLVGVVFNEEFKVINVEFFDSVDSELKEPVINFIRDNVNWNEIIKVKNDSEVYFYTLIPLPAGAKLRN